VTAGPGLAVTAVPYQRIKDYLLAGIAAGEWREGERIPSEPELARRFRVARMTVNRAVRELAAEQVLSRARGSGTFVAPPRHESTLVEIRPISAEIAARGGAHSAAVRRLEAVRAGGPLAEELLLRRGARLFHSVVVHREDGRPVQLEERWVVPAAAPRYLDQDFTSTTPSEYLVQVAPLARVEYRIEARPPTPAAREALELAPGEPCLLLHRRTFSRGRPASVAELWHAGSRYRLTGHL
jgi:GntR family histidine utilization transcriptional repressor